MKKINFGIVFCFAICACISPSIAEENAASLQQQFNAVAQAIYPAVVSITTIHIEQVAGEEDRVPVKNAIFDGFLGELFGYSESESSAPAAPTYEQRHVGVGSGIIVHQDGYVLTNYHLVEDADKDRVTCKLADGIECEGIIVGIDTKYDLALIKIDHSGLRSAELVDSDSIKVGDWAIAIGNPYGFVFDDAQPTMTVGVVSALNRTLPLMMRDGRTYSNLIQTDASINLGNSGGPLVNIDGKVMGINVAIVSTTGGNQGIGFAIPSNHCRDVLARFTEAPQIENGWLGIEAQDMNADLAAYFHVELDKGVVVMNTIKDSPAFKAGIRRGDILTAFNGNTIASVNSLLGFVKSVKPGVPSEIGFVRGEKDGTVSVIIEPRANIK
jgi:S1-C subfamily serine protease